MAETENDFLMTRQLAKDIGRNEPGTGDPGPDIEDESEEISADFDAFDDVDWKKEYEALIEQHVRYTNEANAIIDQQDRALNAARAALTELREGVSVRASALTSASSVVSDPDKVIECAERFVSWITNSVPDDFEALLPASEPVPLGQEGETADEPGDGRREPETQAVEGLDTP